MVTMKHSTHAYTLLLGCLVSTMIVPQVAHAQSEEDIAQAKKLYGQGRSSLEDDKSQDAIKQFTKAYELSKRPQILFYVGQAYEQSGALLEARRFYKQYLDEVPNAPNVEEVLDTVLKLQSKIRKNYAQIEVSTDKSGRALFIEGEDKPRCVSKTDAPCVLTLKPGKIVLIMKPAEGEQLTQKRETISLKAGNKSELKIDLKALDSAQLMVKSDVNDAVLTMDGKRINLPMVSPLKLKPGTYPVNVLRGGEKVWAGDIEVKDNEFSQIYLPLNHTAKAKPSMSNVRIGSYTLISIGVGLLIGGTWMGLQTRDTFNQLDARKTSVDPLLIEKSQDQQFAANTLLISGGLSLATGGGLLAWDIFAGNDERAAPSEEEPAPAEAVDAPEDKKEPAPVAPPIPEDDLL